MNLFGISPTEVLLILIIAMVVLGPEKIPEVAQGIGKMIRDFRLATQELTSSLQNDFPVNEITSEITNMLSLADLSKPLVANPTSNGQEEPATEEPAPTGPPPEWSPAEAAAAYQTIAPAPSNGHVHVSSNYFATVAAPGIDASWTHGANVATRRPFRTLPNTGGIQEDWVHGAPRPRPEPVAEAVAAEAVTDEAVTAEPVADGQSEPASLETLFAYDPAPGSSEDVAHIAGDRDQPAVDDAVSEVPPVPSEFTIVAAAEENTPDAESVEDQPVSSESADEVSEATPAENDSLPSDDTSVPKRRASRPRKPREKIVAHVTAEPTNDTNTAVIDQAADETEDSADTGKQG